MLRTLQKKLRQFVISPDEERVLRFGKAIFFTGKYLRPSLNDPDERGPILGYKVEDRFSIPDMRLTVSGISLAWIQNIQVDIATGHVIVGHFAVDEGLTGTGLAKRLALAFGRYAKTRYGSSSIKFEELKINSNPAYRFFFSKTLGASALDPQQKTWLWTVP